MRDVGAWERFRAWPWWAQVLVWAVLWPVALALLTLSRPPERRRRWWAATTVAGLAWLGIGASGASDDASGESRVDATTTTTANTSTTERAVSATTAPTSATTTPPSPEGAFRTGGTDLVEPRGTDHVVRASEANALLATLAALAVEPEHARAGYDRALFPHWDDADGDACDTRCEVLSAQLRPDGLWLSEWDGYSTGDTTELHVDHVVALAEAWDSGGDAWSPQRRDEFADSMDNLLAVTAATNTAKSDGDAGRVVPVAC